MRSSRSRRFTLGCSTPKRRATASEITRSNLFLPPLLLQSGSNIRPGDLVNGDNSNRDFEESLALSSTQLERLTDSPSSQCQLDSSFISARTALDVDLQRVDWASPIPIEKSSKRTIQCFDENVINKDYKLEINDLSEEMFQSRAEPNCTNNHDSTQFCKTTQYRKEVESLFDKVEMSICGLDDSHIMENVDEGSQKSAKFFETKDSFLLDIQEIDGMPVAQSETNVIKSCNHINKINDFYGLPNIAKSLFVTYKNVTKLYDWQDECLNLDAIKCRKNLIYALPTSGGKTLVAEILMLKEVVCQKKNVLFILPFVALVQEKVWGLSPFAVQMGFLIEEYAAGKGNFPPMKRRKKKSIYIATLEKGLGIVRSLIELNRLNELGLIVVDELHLLGEPTRGSTLEMLLASVMYTPNNIQIIGMSATIGNIDELARFLNAEIYSNQFRPVDLKEYVKVGEAISSIGWTKTGALDIQVHRQVNYNLLEYRSEEKKTLLGALRRESGNLCGVLAGAVPWGVAYHHSGLTAEERRLLEDSFRAGVLSVLCCTSTLAAGVNLPAARVILRSPFVGRDFITLGRYKQMAGRAGRAGFGTVGECIVICPQERYSQLCEVLSQPMDKATSNLHANDGAPLRGFVLSAIALGMAVDRGQILRLLQASLLGVQAERLGLCLKQLTNETLKHLIVSGAVEVVQPSGQSLSADTSDGSKLKLVVYSNSTFKVSQLGKAAIKGCMDLTVAHQLYADMEIAQQGLVVIGALHLLYLVTPYEYTDVQPNMAAYYSIYSNLDGEGKQTAKVLGITESNAVRMVTGKTITNVPERVLSRFYVTLMLHDLWCQVPVADVADKYHVSRGKVQTMLAATASFACSALRFCEELPELWAFRDLLQNFARRIAHCCAPELLPLMELPSVKKGRAMQLYRAGYKRIEDVARASPSDLVESIEHMSTKLAVQLISSAKMLLIEKVENLREEAEDVMDGLGVLSMQ